jgi:hypothetical protein
MSTIIHRTLILLMVALALIGIGAKGANAADVTVTMSGWEFFPGVPCTLDGEPATCGATFGGWTGGSGANAGGWTPFPGDRRGLWWAQLDRTGEAGFGKTVTIEGGRWELFLRQGWRVVKLSGVMLEGTVQWPVQTGDLGCGTSVGKVEAALVVTELGGASATFEGCLHDLPAGQIIPPRIWGTLALD